MAEHAAGQLDTVLQEDREFPPSAAFSAQANWNDPAVYERANADPVAFWEAMAANVSWFTPWERVLDWDVPWASWFVGATTNACYNAVDRHVEAGRGDRIALLWEGEPGDVRRISYAELQADVVRAAAALRANGVHKGDRVAIYLGMIPEAAVAMLACARLGATHTVVFGGFSPEALSDRIADCGATILITADGAWRRGGKVPLWDNATRALATAPTVRRVLVVNRTDDPATVTLDPSRDSWWHEALAAVDGVDVPCEPVDSEHPLFVLYTSGTTGKPKGMLHTTGGYLVGTITTAKAVLDLKDDDLYWCTADVGWVTGHSYLVYGPLGNGATCFMFEGTPDYPGKDRYWEMIARHRITILYTAPTSIRAFMRDGPALPAGHDLSSLRLLGSVGEPINPEAWMWYREHIGGDRTPVVDTWWQTETGGIMITPLPGLTTTKPGSATFPFPGIGADVVDEAGEPIGVGGGYLVLTHPWPSMARSIWGDPERYRDTYWSRFPGRYFAGDGAKRDAGGYLWLLGRVDDVLNVAGHRIGTMEVESALVANPAVAEAAVIGIDHDIKGQALAAFCTLRAGFDPGPEMVETLRSWVAEKIGAIAKPDKIFFTYELPKTRSAKIMRRLLRDIAEGRVVGDTTTLADPSVLAAIKSQYDDSE